MSEESQSPASCMISERLKSEQRRLMSEGIDASEALSRARMSLTEEEYATWLGMSVEDIRANRAWYDERNMTTDDSHPLTGGSG